MAATRHLSVNNHCPSNTNFHQKLSLYYSKVTQMCIAGSYKLDNRHFFACIWWNRALSFGHYGLFSLVTACKLSWKYMNFRNVYEYKGQSNLYHLGTRHSRGHVHQQASECKIRLTCTLLPTCSCQSTWLPHTQLLGRSLQVSQTSNDKALVVHEEGEGRWERRERMVVSIPVNYSLSTITC